MCYNAGFQCDETCSCRNCENITGGKKKKKAKTSSKKQEMDEETETEAKTEVDFHEEEEEEDEEEMEAAMEAMDNLKAGSVESPASDPMESMPLMPGLAYDYDYSEFGIAVPSPLVKAEPDFHHAEV